MGLSQKRKAMGMNKCNGNNVSEGKKMKNMSQIDTSPFWWYIPKYTLKCVLKYILIETLYTRLTSIPVLGDSLILLITTGSRYLKKNSDLKNHPPVLGIWKNQIQITDKLFQGNIWELGIYLFENNIFEPWEPPWYPFGCSF